MAYTLEVEVATTAKTTALSRKSFIVLNCLCYRYVEWMLSLLIDYRFYELIILETLERSWIGWRCTNTKIQFTVHQNQKQDMMDLSFNKARSFGRVAFQFHRCVSWRNHTSAHENLIGRWIECCPKKTPYLRRILKGWLMMLLLREETHKK